MVARRTQKPAIHIRGSHPVQRSFPRKLNTAALLAEQLEITIRGANPDFHGELVPLQSPLLREYLLVSHPPLTYMLKFSGSSDLIASFCSNAISQDPEATALQALATRTCHLQRTAKRLRQGAPLERQWRTPTTVLPQ